MNTIEVHVDKNCDMAKVSVNNQCFLLGNFWDFHPGCHGNSFEFKGYRDLALKLQEQIISHGAPVEIILDDQWTYED